MCANVQFSLYNPIRSLHNWIKIYVYPIVFQPNLLQVHKILLSMTYSSSYSCLVVIAFLPASDVLVHLGLGALLITNFDHTSLQDAGETS